MMPGSDLRRKKVLAISSGGGHWVELMRLRPAFIHHNVAFATVFPEYREDVVDAPFYTIPDISRFNKRKLPSVATRVLDIIYREKPDVVISTGALPGLIALVAAKSLFQAKTIWIDSIANSGQLSTSGAFAKSVADIWLTQWPELAGRSRKGPEHWGAVL